MIAADESADYLSADEIASLTAIAAKHGLTVEIILDSARKARLKAGGGAEDNAFLVDPPQSSAPPSLSVRKVVVQVRQKQAIPLTVAPITDEEWQALSPHMFCRSRTLGRRQMLYRSLRFALGHAQTKNPYDCSMAAWLSYEVTRYRGNRLRQMCDAAKGHVSDQRQRELEALAQYAEQRAAGRSQFED